MNNIINVYSSYELIKLTLLALLIIIPMSIFYFLRSNSKKMLLFVIFSQVFSMALSLLILFIGEKYFNTITNGLNQITLFMTLLFNNLNLAIFTTESILDMKMKDPDPDRVNRHHFKSTLNMIIVFILLGLSVGLFMPSELGQTVISISVGTILSIVVNHLVIRKIFIDEKN